MNTSFLNRIAFGLVLVLSSTLCSIAHAAPGDPTRYNYEDAKNLYGTNKRLQDLIDARNARIRRNLEMLDRLRRESRANGVDAVLNNGDIQALERAIESDRRDIRLYEHRQSIVARNWDKSNLRTYYGSLEETSRRSIYDPKTRRERNLMDYRIDAFRNPHQRQASPGPGRHTDQRVSDRSHTRSHGRNDPGAHSRTLSHPTTHTSSRNRPSGNTSSRSRSQGNTGSTSRSTHTITLTPTK